MENFLSTPKKVFILIKQQDLVERDTLVSIRKVNQLKKQKINSAIKKKSHYDYFLKLSCVSLDHYNNGNYFLEFL